MIVGTAGHIDHGKTALVKALTGVDADRLKEEKARGITIDLGYAYSDLGDGRQLGFVDVPGHERFVHNMLAGATGIDAALLVVSVAEGIKPQTVEHLQIVDLLGLDRGIVALTKADLADDDQILERMAEIETLLADDLAQGRGDRAGLGADRAGRRRAQDQAAGAGRKRQGRHRLRAPGGRSLLRPDRRGRRRHRHRPCRRDQGRRSAAAHAVGAGGARALAARPEPRGRGRPRRRALRAQPDRAAALEGRDPARRLGGEPRAARADRPARRAPPPARLGGPAAQALVAGACSSRRGPRHGPRGAARRRQAGAGRHGAGAARARGQDRRAVRRPRHPARSVGHPHRRGRRGDRSVRSAAQPPLRAAAGRTPARWARATPMCCRSCCGWNRASSRPAASARRAISGRSTSTRLLQAAGGAKLEGFGFLAETLAAARKDIVATLAAHHQDQARRARPAARAPQGRRSRSAGRRPCSRRCSTRRCGPRR